jgi:FKBP-type peptidyl-prolyl cis-trans isomerase (trigger factor)
MEKTKPKADRQKRTAKLSWLPKKTFELEFVIPWNEVKKTFDKVLKEVAQEITLKGFRKGKAPLNLVEKNIDKQKLYKRVLEQLLPQTYGQAVKQHRLQPLISPKITPLSAQEGKDWQFKAVACEAPEVKLGNYQETIRGELAKEKIWLPGKEKAGEKKDKKISYDEKLKKITNLLLEKVKVEVADVLVEDELNRMLSRLLDQINSLGMTIEQYLSSKGMTQEKLRVNYRKQAEDTLRLEFILQTLVVDRKIKVKKEEVDKMIQATPDKKMREKLDTPLQKNYIASILAKRKALDYLTSL